VQAALYVVTAAATEVILIMANVAIDVARTAGLPPQLVVMTLAMAAADSCMKANVAARKPDSG
jgi:hypothetical protein